MIPDPLRLTTTITCSAAFGFRPEIVAGDNDLGDLAVRASGAVRGRVVDREGRGQVGAIVRSPAQQGEYAVEQAVTDANGEFVLGHLSPALRTISAHLRAGVPSSVATAVVELGQMKELDDFVLTPLPTIGGVVVDALGAPARDVSLRIRSSASRHTLFVTSDANGAFSAPTAESCTISVSAWRNCDGFVEPSDSLISHEPGESDIRVVVKLRPKLTFRVTDAQTGAPIETFGIKIDDEVSDVEFMVPDLVLEVHPGGEFESVADAGRSIVLVEAPGYAPFEASVTSENVQSLALTRGSKLRGRAVVNGVPAADVAIELRRDTWDSGRVRKPTESNLESAAHDLDLFMGRSQTVRSSPTGSFAFDSLAPGTYLLELSGGHVVSRNLRRIVVAEGVTNDLGDVPLERGGGVMGRLIAPAGESCAGFVVDVHRIDREPERAWSIENIPFYDPEMCSFKSTDARRITIARADGRFECQGLRAGRYGAQWARPEDSYGVTFADADVVANVDVQSGRASELVLDASESAPSTVVVHVVDGVKPVSGCWVDAFVDRAGHAGSYDPNPFARGGTRLGMTDAAGLVAGRVEGKTRFRLRVSDSKGVALYEGLELLEAKTRERNEHDIRLDSGPLQLVMPSNLVTPEHGWIRVVLKSNGISDRAFDVRTKDGGPEPRQATWSGPTIDLGAVLAREYSVEVSAYRFERARNAWQESPPIPLVESFHTKITVEANRVARIEIH